MPHCFKHSVRFWGVGSSSIKRGETISGEIPKWPAWMHGVGCVSSKLNVAQQSKVHFLLRPKYRGTTLKLVENDHRWRSSLALQIPHPSPACCRLRHYYLAKPPRLPPFWLQWTPRQSAFCAPGAVGSGHVGSEWTQTSQGSIRLRWNSWH